VGAVTGTVEDVAEAADVGFDLAADLLQGRLEQAIKDALKHVLELVVKTVAKIAGLSGRPQALAAYEELFQSIVVPNKSATYGDDYSFARARVAGPNPMVIQNVTAVPDNFPVDAGKFAEVMKGDSLEAALAEGRVFLCDYAPLSVMANGTVPQQKYACAPLGLFATKPKGDKALVAVAIQCAQAPSKDAPVLYPFDGERWELAKMHLSCADGNYHELISHLGLTHLLVEPFAVATHRCLVPTHPLFVLLMPHFQGTLFINSAAVTSLINPGGTVDQLLAGTIESDWKVVTDALGAVQFKDVAVPIALAKRGVDNKDTLKDFPYRDDALRVWEAVDKFVSKYVNLYYEADSGVAGDAALQAWAQELASKDGGCVKGLLEEGSQGIATKKYLKQVLTTIIFTASAQHAAVNFPQASFMSYTPLMPLAAYGPPPTDEVTTTTVLQQLPPMEMALLQLLVAKALGGVYFTRLGQYDRHQERLTGVKPYFKDARAQELMDEFKGRLVDVERDIGRDNEKRGTYVHLLPSRIPQSINI